MEDKAQLNPGPSWCLADPRQGECMGFSGSNAEFIVYRGKFEAAQPLSAPSQCLLLSTPSP